MLKQIYLKPFILLVLFILVLPMFVLYQLCLVLGKKSQKEEFYKVQKMSKQQGKLLKQGCRILKVIFTVMQTVYLVVVVLSITLCKEMTLLGETHYNLVEELMDMHSLTLHVLIQSMVTQIRFNHLHLL